MCHLWAASCLPQSTKLAQVGAVVLERYSVNLQSRPTQRPVTRVCALGAPP
jgi:hypothetical protein